MRQRKLGSHTPPCHKRMVITTLFSVLLAALQRRPVLYHTRWLLTVHRHWSSGHLGQLAPTTHPQCRLVSNPCPAGRDPVILALWVSLLLSPFHSLVLTPSLSLLLHLSVPFPRDTGGGGGYYVNMW